MDITDKIFKLNNLDFELHSIISDKSGFNFTIRFDEIEEMFKFKNKIRKMTEKLQKERR